MDGAEEGGEDGASVGEEVSEASGNAEGSKSRSGRGDVSTGRRVTRSISRRRTALWSCLGQRYAYKAGNCALESFEQHDALPSRLIGGRPPQTHLNQQLHELDQLEYTCSPFVAAVCITPSSRVARVRRRRDERLSFRVRLQNSGKQCVMVQASDIEQSGDYEQGI